jgi:FdhD protein
LQFDTKRLFKHDFPAAILHLNNLGDDLLTLIIMANSSTQPVRVTKVAGTDSTGQDDLLAVEEPLEIRLKFIADGLPAVKNVSVTMRTPGNDAELATGFLFTEGIIKGNGDIAQITHDALACGEGKQNTILVAMKEGISPNLHNTERNFYTTSSCGVCGKGSISAIRTVSVFETQKSKHFTVDAEILYGLPEILRSQQATFESTGGLHASALFNKNGELLLLREDVGRHNALDKVIGAALQNNWLPLHDKILLLSGRASFELVQKAAMAGITLIAAVGAPSSLAVELAEELNITLAGFLRGRRFNIYTAASRIVLPVNENTY